MPTRTIDDIQRDMAAVLEGTDDRALNNQEIASYEELERELDATRASDAIRARDAAYRGPAPVPTPPLAVDAEENGRDSAAYSRAFRSYLRTGSEHQLQQAHAAGRRAQQGEGIPAEGGVLVPTTFRQKLVEALKAFGGLAEVVDTYTTGDGRPVTWPTIDDTGNLGEIVEEHGTFSAGADLVFGETALSAYSYATGGKDALPIRISWELIQDAAFDVEALIARLFAIRIQRIQAIHLVTGTGVEQPEGILTGKVPVQAAANTGLTWQDLVTIKHSVDPAYRPGSRWAFNDATAAMIEKMVDSHGDPIMLLRGSRDLRASSDYDTLLGYPVTIDQAFPTYVNNTATAAGVFGNLREGYVRRIVREVQMVADPYSRSRYRQTEISAWARMDAAQQNSSAYVAFSGKGA